MSLPTTVNNRLNRAWGDTLAKHKQALQDCRPVIRELIILTQQEIARDRGMCDSDKNASIKGLADFWDVIETLKTDLVPEVKVKARPSLHPLPD